MIFYRTFSFTGNNDYIFYTRFYCFLHNIFDCRSITIGNISFGIALVADKKCVPKPAAGIIAFLTFSLVITYFIYFVISIFFTCCSNIINLLNCQTAHLLSKQIHYWITCEYKITLSVLERQF